MSGKFKLGVWLIAVVAMVGCSTIRNAREAQRTLAFKGREARSSVSPLDLRGKALSELVGFALTNRPSIVASRLAVKDARLAMKEASTSAPILSSTPWTAPKLTVAGEHGEKSGELSDRHGGDWRTYGDPSASLSLDLLIWDFGRYSATAEEKAELTVAAELQLAQNGYTVFYEVSKAYFDYLEKAALFEVAVSNETRYAMQLELAEERDRAGEADKLDVLRARLDYTQARQQTVAASNLVTTSGAELMNALGVEAERGTVETVFGCPESGIDSVRRGFSASDYGVEEAFALARTNAPAMRVKRAEFRAASHKVDYAIADMMPTISASTSMSWTDPLWVWKWGVKIAKSLQMYRHTTPVDRAVVALEKAASEVDKAEQTLSRDIEVAIATRDNAIEALKTASASVRSARENYDTVMSQWGIGDVSRVEISQAMSEYSTAVGQRVSAFYDGQRAEAALFALVGTMPRYNEGREKVEE